jgi:GxxExxY protein
MILYGDITQPLLAAALEVHRTLGPGLLESTYEECLCHELALREINFERQVTMPVRYKSVELEAGYRLDLIVEDKVILELKSVDQLLPIHQAQLLTYLRLSRKRVGFLINFNVPVLKQGLIRRVL